MLTGNFDDVRRIFPDAYPLVQKFARRHVSRFPMTFGLTTGGWVAFYDSRFAEPVGFLRKGNNKLTVQSDLIHNHQFRKNSTGYNTRSTTNPKLIEQWLPQYVRLVDNENIYKQSDETARDLHGRWKNQFHMEVDGFLSSYGDTARKVRQAFVSDMLSSLMDGTEPYSHPDLQPFKTPEFVSRITEHKSRSKINAPTNNIFINPDETVVHWVSNEIKTYNSVNQLDDDTRGKLALLKMAEDKSVVGYVGIKISSNNFWLY